MTRVKNLRPGDKFVVAGEHGVWKMGAGLKAKCVFGTKDIKDTISQFNPEAFAFIVSEEQGNVQDMPATEQPMPLAEGRIRVVGKTDSENESNEFDVSVSEHEAAIMAAAEHVAVMIGNRNVSFSVHGTGYDVSNRILMLEVER